MTSLYDALRQAHLGRTLSDLQGRVRRSLRDPERPQRPASPTPTAFTTATFSLRNGGRRDTTNRSPNRRTPHDEPQHAP